MSTLSLIDDLKAARKACTQARTMLERVPLEARTPRHRELQGSLELMLEELEAELADARYRLQLEVRQAAKEAAS